MAPLGLPLNYSFINDALIECIAALRPANKISNDFTRVIPRHLSADVFNLFRCQKTFGYLTRGRFGSV